MTPGSTNLAARFGTALLCALTLSSLTPPSPTTGAPEPQAIAATLPAAPAPAAPPRIVTPPKPEPMRVKSRLTRPESFQHGAWVWDDSKAPPGEVIVAVDLAAQTMSVFRAGHEIGTAVILYGDAVSPTPLGTFPVTEKDADHISNIYHTPMPYAMRLTNDGIFVHGSNVRWGWGSNGCVGIPVPFAKKLFAQSEIGTRVHIGNNRDLAIGKPVLPA